MKKQILIFLFSLISISVMSYPDMYGNDYNVLETVTVDNMRFSILGDRVIVYDGEETHVDTTFYYAYVDGPSDKSLSGDVVIPSKISYKGRDIAVQSINNFSNCTKIVSLTIPKSVKEIINFQNCTSLETINIESDDIIIGGNAFENTAWYDKQPDGLVYLGNALYKYKGTIPENSKITLREGTTSISGLAFGSRYGIVYGLISIAMPNTVKYLGASSFLNCSKLNEVVMSDNLEYIGSKCFYQCGLTEISIPSKVRYIRSGAFFQCPLNAVHIKDLNAWYNINYQIFNSTEPSNPLETAHHLYLNGEEVTSVTLPEGMTQLNSCVFQGGTEIKSLKIPASVTSIGSYAFNGCKLENIITMNPNITIGSSCFTSRSLNHAMVYIPEGTWPDAIYEGDWYLFNNIREVSMKPASILSSNAYTLMNTDTFGYAIYDGESDEVKMAKAFYSLDENDINNCWQVQSQGDRKYLYNIGARKYATIGVDGKIKLTSNATAISMTESESGITLGSDTSHHWGFVKNNSQEGTTGITTLTGNADQSTETYYSLDGKQIESPRKGVNIVRTSNGKTKKVVIR